MANKQRAKIKLKYKAELKIKAGYTQFINCMMTVP